MKFFKDQTKTTVWRYYGFVFLKNFAFFSAVLVPFFTEWGGINLIQVQFLQSWFMFWIFMLEIPTGAVADFLGRKHSITLGAIIMTIAVLIYGSTPNFYIFLLSEFLFAGAVALMSGADQALLYDYLKENGREEESKKIFGKAHAIGLLGILVSAPIGSLMAVKGLNYPMLLSAIPFFAAVLVGWSIPEPKVQGQQSERKRYWDIAFKGTIFFYQHKTLLKLALDAVMVSAAAYFVIWMYQPLLKNINVPIQYYGIVLAGLVATEIAISTNFVRLEKLFGSGRNLLRFSALVTGLTFILVAIMPNLITVSLFILLAGGFGLTRAELMFAYMNKYIPSAQRATVLSSISMFRRLALVFLNPIVGFAADRSLPLALIGIGILPLIVFFFSPISQEMLEEEEE